MTLDSFEPPTDFVIDAEQHAAFARDGYLVIPGVVGTDRVEAALRVVNHWLDSGFDSRERETYDAQSFAPEHRGDPVILGLLTETQGLAAADALVGQPLVRPASAQITLRFPAAPGQELGPVGAHLDGLPSARNGVAADGRVHSFTALAGVLLSDCPPGPHGNFTVWPGTHLAMARWFREHGTGVAAPDAFFAALPELAATSEPVPIVGRAGDLVLAHFLLLHSSGLHAGPHIRYLVFFRLKAPQHEERGDAPLTDPWLEWPAFTASDG